MARSATLRVGCHNVNGLAAKVSALTALWRQLRLDVVAAVDTHVGFFDRSSVQRSLRNAGWQSFWCCSLPGIAEHGRARAGIAVLVRRDLIDSTVISIVGEAQTPTAGPALGRLLLVPMTWAGQRLDMLAVYMHASDAASNAAIISGPLRDFYETAHPNCLVLGDFNFVTDCSLDRRHVGMVQHSQQHDTVPSAAWSSNMTGLHDAWRVLHQQRRAYTYVRSDVASRLDRVYVSSPILRQVVMCTHADFVPPSSDHCPVFV